MGLGRMAARFSEVGKMKITYLVACWWTWWTRRESESIDKIFCQSTKYLEVKVVKKKIMALKGEKELICKVIMVGRQLELISKLKCLKFVLDESVTDGLECCRKITSGKKVVNAIRSLVSDRILQLQYAWVLDKNLFMPV